MNSGAFAAPPGAAICGPPTRRHPSSYPEGSEATLLAGALRRQMSANQCQDPGESTNRLIL